MELWALLAFFLTLKKCYFNETQKSRENLLSREVLATATMFTPFIRKYRRPLLFFILIATFALYIYTGATDKWLARYSRAAESEPYRSLENSGIKHRIIFAGDYGYAYPPMVELLRQRISRAPDATLTLFLGDNLYPRGIPKRTHPLYPRMINTLRELTRSVSNYSSAGIFVPGNHDWDGSGPGGYENILRQARHVKNLLGPKSFYPKGGCPGPVFLTPFPKIQLVVIDSEWWLHSFKKPEGNKSRCRAKSKEEFLALLKEGLANTPHGKESILVMHHPLRSNGLHGEGEYCPHDLNCESYYSFRSEMIALLEEYRPLLCVAGHDHNVQILEGMLGCQYYVVSGAGNKDRSPVRPSNELLYASSDDELVEVVEGVRGELELRVFGGEGVVFSREVGSMG